VTDPVTRRAAVAVVLRQAFPESGIDILFIRRAEHPHDPWSGQMAFPGGRWEPEDVDLRCTAMRETLEEIGLDLETTAEFLGPLDEIRGTARMKPLDLAISPFVFRLDRHDAPLSLSSEVRSVHWLPLDALLGPDHRTTMEYRHGDAALTLPCLRLEELTIWGLTYRMFVSLEAALGRS
jgi:8-oxo-dGTP pyrophosphatase MutT (NUDIX family)